MADNQYASLIFNNKASADLGILIQYPFQVVHPQIDGDPTHIEGRSGDFLPDVNSYQNVTETFNVIVNRSPNLSQADWERQVTDWLTSPVVRGRRQYQYLQFDYDPDYAYSAIQKDPFSFQWDETNIGRATGQIPFYCEPFQYRVDGINYIDLPSQGIVYNQELRDAIPNWHFIANGSFSLIVNNKEYQFDNMNGEFWVNGDTCDTYDGNHNLLNDQTHFPNLITPILTPGENHISITAGAGVIQKAEYMPRWRRLI